MKLRVVLGVFCTLCMICSGLVASIKPVYADVAVPGTGLKGKGVCDAPGGCDGSTIGYDGVPWRDKHCQGDPSENRIYAVVIKCRWTPNGSETQRCEEQELICYWQFVYQGPNCVGPYVEHQHGKQGCSNGGPG